MGGCFPCFGSSNEEGSGVQEVTKKDSVKEGSAAQSHHVTRVSSGLKKKKKSHLLLYMSIFFFFFLRRNRSGFMLFSVLVTGFGLVLLNYVFFVVIFYVFSRDRLLGRIFVVVLI